MSLEKSTHMHMSQAAWCLLLHVTPRHGRVTLASATRAFLVKCFLLFFVGFVGCD